MHKNVREVGGCVNLPNEAVVLVDGAIRRFCPVEAHVVGLCRFFMSSMGRRKEVAAAGSAKGWSEKCSSWPAHKPKVVIAV